MYMKKWIPAVLGATMIFSASSVSVFAATPVNTAQTQASTATAITKASSNGYTVNLDQNSICSNTALQKLLGLKQDKMLEQLKAGKTLADLAKANNATTTEVANALLQPQLTKLEKNVKAGKLTSTQSSIIKKDLTKQLNTFVNKKTTTAVVVNTSAKAKSSLADHSKTAAATVLKLSEKELAQQIKTGKSIVDIAKAEGIDQSKVINTIVAKEKTWIETQLNQSWKNTSAALTTDQQQFKDSGYLAQAAKVLNLTETKLQTQLANGKTWSDIADEQNVTSDALKEHLHTFAQQQVTNQCNQAS